MSDERASGGHVESGQVYFHPSCGYIIPADVARRFASETLDRLNRQPDEDER